MFLTGQTDAFSVDKSVYIDYFRREWHLKKSKSYDMYGTNVTNHYPCS